MVDAVLVDGQPTPADWLSERAFQFGDGLFETIAVIDGILCLWDAHMQRLLRGCERLRLPKPDVDVLYNDARQLCHDTDCAVLKMYWTAGRSQRGYRRPSPLTPQRIMSRSPWPYTEVQTHWVVCQCTHRLSENTVLAGIKHLNRLDQVIARSEWDDPQIHEGVMLGQDGRVVCGTMSNLLLQFEDHLLTPSISDAGIDGVVRQLLIETAQRVGADIRIADVGLAELQKAQAVYFTNSLIGVVRAARVGETVYDTHVAEHPVIADVRKACHGTLPEGRV